MRDNCNTKFEQVDRSRICLQHRTNKLAKNPQKRMVKRQVGFRLPQFEMLHSDPYRMYLYLLEKMEQDNLAIINKPKHRWWKISRSINNV